MDALRIFGGAPLRGEIQVSGSKNACLPAIAATLLHRGESTIEAVPDLADVRTMANLLGYMGAKVQQQPGRIVVDARHIERREAPYDLVRTMRAAILVLGPLVARFGQARISLPGGCAIGARPIDQHLKGLQRLGAQITIEHGYVEARAEKLRGAEIVFDLPTVTGTENLMLAASGAQGTTILKNAAREPEVVDLAQALISMGVTIEGAGTESIVVHGGDALHALHHRVVPDRIELGTFLVAGALMGDGLRIVGGIADHQAVLIDKLRQTGATIRVDGDALSVDRAKRPHAVDVQTAPYPGFPTDMQAQFMALMAIAEGTSVISETIFENRFMHVAELNRLGASIRVEGGRAVVRGAPKLSGSTVMATDLRASACLVLAGLVADSETVVRRIYHLDRGYERIESKLRQVGARIERFKE
jgi:UDP-N-acetylglucosamine 1-carboxyvinyltransferase